ncbi:MAG: hypothetical protein RL681_668 [Candidatus Parcubacteria bacterium]|jgi:hypothetical protein
MGKSIESQWRGGDPLIRAIEAGAGQSTVEQYLQLPEEAQRLVRETLRSMKEEAKKSPRELIQALPVIISFFDELHPGSRKEEGRLVYDTEGGSHVSDAELSKLVETQIAQWEEQLKESGQKPAKQALN